MTPEEERDWREFLGIDAEFLARAEECARFNAQQDALARKEAVKRRKAANPETYRRIHLAFDAKITAIRKEFNCSTLEARAIHKALREEQKRETL